MKLPILILSFFAVTSAIYAQNPRIETLGDKQMHTYKYMKGGDSISFTIIGKNDTVQTMKLYRSGKTASIVWKTDSFYTFDIFGHLKDKMYSFENGEFTTDNLVSFFKNGRVHIRRSFKNNSRLEELYQEDGQLLNLEQTQYFAKRNMYQNVDAKGRLLSSKRVDTTTLAGNINIRVYDTLFYRNGRVMTLSIYENSISLGKKYFNQDGSLADEELPDSLELISFKDNVDCYYGLKNKRGDTIIKPMFDHIYDFRDAFWAAYSGKSLKLFNLNGSPAPTFATQLSDIYDLRSFSANENKTLGKPDAPSQRMDYPFNLNANYFGFQDGEKYGVVDAKMNVVVPPQYFKVSDESIDNGSFFNFTDIQKDTIVRVGYLNRQGKPLFADRFKSVYHSTQADYFFLCTELDLQNRRVREEEEEERRNFFVTSKSHVFGLGASDGTVLIKPQFKSIFNVKYTPLFIASTQKSYIAKLNKKEKHLKKANNADEENEDAADEKQGFEELNRDKTLIEQHGIYDARARRWLLDTVDFFVTNYLFTTHKYLCIKDIRHKKYGLMNTEGQFVLPMVYDSIGWVGNGAFFIVKKGKKYQIVDFNAKNASIHKTQYNFLAAFKHGYDWDDGTNAVYYFIAKRNNKWGIIDADEKIIKPFDYDYASLHDRSWESVLLVKDNHAGHFDFESLPNETGTYPHLATYKVTKKMGHYKLIDNSQRAFFINDTGKVVLPPQYKLLNEAYYGDYVLAEDEAKRRKIVFFGTGKVIDFPFDYSVAQASSRSSLMLVKNEKMDTYGVVSTDGKLLAEGNNYGVAVGDIETATFFVKRDTPLLVCERNNLGEREPFSIQQDTLSLEDTNWEMFNGDGKSMNNTSFDFPINFQNGIGVGRQNGQFNLYKTDGSIVPPFTKNVLATNNSLSLRGTKQEGGKLSTTRNEKKITSFQNIRRDPDLGFYTLFYPQGMASAMMITKKDGEIIVDGGRYTGISKFYDKYALVRVGNKVGLIDSFGREVIAPQDLRTYSGHFMDSLDVRNKRERLENPNKHRYLADNTIEQPIQFYTGRQDDQTHPDSLAITDFQRAALWNLLSEQCPNILSANDFDIPRVAWQETTRFFSSSHADPYNVSIRPNKVSLGDSTVSFTILKSMTRIQRVYDFYNFYRKNGRWEELTINDLLQVQGEKRWLLNDLITKKIKALKDQQIDCSNTSAFITTVENRFMLTKTGVDFCFDSTGGRSEFVVIAFTWAELTPFLKMKIY